MVRRGLPIVLAVTAVALGLAVAGKSWCGIPAGNEALYLHWCYSDVPPLFFTEHLHEGATPYLDHPVEYPVLTGGVMWLAAAVSSGVHGFWWATVAILVVAGLVTAWLLQAEVGWRRALAFAAAPTLVVSGVVNWDLPAVLLATAGLVAHRRGRDTVAGLALGLGTAAKLFPALFVLPAALAAWRLRGRAAGWRTVGAAGGAWLAVNVPVFLAAPDGWGRFLELSRERGSDWDALSSIVLRLTGASVSTGTLNALLLVLFLAGYAAVLAATVRRAPPEQWHHAALPLLVWFLLASKVYSPQFSVWLLPLFALTFPGWRPWAAFAVVDVAVTLTRFRYLGSFVDGGLDGAWPWPPFALALTARAAVLVWVARRGWARAGTVAA